MMQHEGHGGPRPFSRAMPSAPLARASLRPLLARLPLACGETDPLRVCAISCVISMRYESPCETLFTGNCTADAAEMPFRARNAGFCQGGNGRPYEYYQLDNGTRWISHVFRACLHEHSLPAPRATAIASWGESDSLPRVSGGEFAAARRLCSRAHAEGGSSW